MTVFLDLRMSWGGGEVSPEVQVCSGASRADYAPYGLERLLELVRGKDVLLATHGFNTNRQEGIEQLSSWAALLTLPEEAVFLGLLWPGDSESWHALCYPAEPHVAMQAGEAAAAFLNRHLGAAATLSLASHSLGARVMLQTARRLERPARHLILMAAAIDDDALTNEYRDAAARAGTISLLASKKDTVLEWAFPLGNFVSDFFDHTHPWWSSALGRSGPQQAPANYRPGCMIPDAWAYNHGDYLREWPKPQGKLAPPVEPPPSAPRPLQGADGWQEAWSAAFVSSRFARR